MGEGRRAIYTRGGESKFESWGSARRNYGPIMVLLRMWTIWLIFLYGIVSVGKWGRWEISRTKTRVKELTCVL